MTILPRFSLTQDYSNVYIKIHVPYVRVVGCTEIIISGREFHFYCKPYLLHLSFPHKVVNEEGDCEDNNYTLAESTNSKFKTGSSSSSSHAQTLLVEEVNVMENDDEECHITSIEEEGPNTDVTAISPSERPASPLASILHPNDNNRKVRHATASYDPSDNHGTLLVTLPKQIPGQYFSDLDLITKLLQNEKRKPLQSHGSRKDLIQVLDMDDNKYVNSTFGVEAEEEVSISPDAAGGEELTNLASTSLSFSYSRYGFLQSYHGVFTDLQEEFIPSQDGLFELPYHPEHLMLHGSTVQRRDQRLQTEDETFDMDRFLQDYDLHFEELEQQDMVYQEAIQMVPHWHPSTNQRDNTTNMELQQGHENETTIHPDTVDNITEQMSTLHMNATSERALASSSSSSSKTAVVALTSSIGPSTINPIGQKDIDKDITTKDFLFTSQERDTLVKIGLLKGGKHFRRCNNQCRQSSSYSTPITTACTDDQHRDAILIGLFDLLFAYCYDHRMTGGEPSCESAWTITILSPMLSWLESYYHQLDDNGGTISVEPITRVVCYCIRRSLIYPYIRNWDFSTNVILEDVIQILLLGRRTILSCLLQIRTILEHTTSNDSCRYYLLNTIFIDDYCIWIQSLDEKYIKEFSNSVREEVDQLKSQNWASEFYLLYTRLGIENILGNISSEEESTSGYYSRSSTTSNSSDAVSAT